MDESEQTTRDTAAGKNNSSDDKLFWTRHSAIWVPIVVVLLGGLGYLIKEFLETLKSVPTLIVYVEGCQETITVSLDANTQQSKQLSPGERMTRFEKVEQGPHSLYITCEGYLPWNDDIKVTGRKIQKVTADFSKKEPVGVPNDQGSLSVTMDAVIVYQTCDTGSARKNAELRWLITLDEQKFASPGITRIPPGKPFQLENIYLATDKDLITVTIEMWEYDDKNRAVGSNNKQELVISRSDFSGTSSLSDEIQMWPGQQRNECDIRVSWTAKQI